MALCAAALFGLLVLPTAKINADGPDKAEVVVVFPGEKGTVRSISFTSSISRVGALTLAGWNVVANGDSICSIEGVGCPASDCFCAQNWWLSAGWDHSSVAWDTTTWPPPPLAHGDIVGFRWSQADWGPPRLPGPAYAAAAKALGWLSGQQSAADGGYGNASGTAEMLLAIGANQLQAANWRRQADSPSLLSYLLARGVAYANSGVSEAGKLAVGLSAGSGCWPTQAKAPLAYYQPATGNFGSSYSSGFQAWAILGTRALSQPVPVAAINLLRNTQQPSGGWEWAPDWGSDTNSTALAIQALLATGEPVASPAISNGLNYLDQAQNNDGGFPYDPNAPWGDTSDANSTAYVIQALLAAGQDPLTPTWTVATNNPISYLLALQLADGSFAWQTGQGANQLATQQAVPALLGRSFPLAAGPVPDCYSLQLPAIFKNS
jgi:hypothetical protein